MESIEKVGKRAQQSMAQALRRQELAQQDVYSFDAPDVDRAEPEFPVIVKTRSPLSFKEASALLDSILDEHFDTIESLGK